MIRQPAFLQLCFGEERLFAAGHFVEVGFDAREEGVEFGFEGGEEGLLGGLEGGLGDEFEMLGRCVSFVFL
jgi:hypothetical protein